MSSLRSGQTRKARPTQPRSWAAWSGTSWSSGNDDFEPRRLVEAVEVHSQARGAAVAGTLRVVGVRPDPREQPEREHIARAIEGGGRERIERDRHFRRR